MRDYSNCEIDYTQGFNGANGSKLSANVDGEMWILKFKNNDKKTGKETFGFISEYAASHIANYLGINSHETNLGKYNDKDVVAVKNFAPDSNRTKFYDFASLKNQIIDSEKNGYGTELDEILQTFREQKLFDPKELESYFWDTFVMDSIVGNFDRHNGNWGYVKNLETNEVELSPRFDFGSCLFPKANDELLASFLTNEEEIEKRVYQFPNSAIKQNDVKINYYNFLNDTEKLPPLLCKSLCNFVNFYKKAELNLKNYVLHDPAFDELSPIRREFYATIVSERYEKIVVKAYEKYKNSSRDKILNVLKEPTDAVYNLIKNEYIPDIEAGLAERDIPFFEFEKDGGTGVCVLNKDASAFLEIQKEIFSINKKFDIEEVSTLVNADIENDNFELI